MDDWTGFYKLMTDRLTNRQTNGRTLIDVKSLSRLKKVHTRKVNIHIPIFIMELDP